MELNQFGPVENYELSFCASGLDKDQEEPFLAGYLAGFQTGGQLFEEIFREMFLQNTKT